VSIQRRVEISLSRRHHIGIPLLVESCWYPQVVAHTFCFLRDVRDHKSARNHGFQSDTSTTHACISFIYIYIYMLFLTSPNVCVCGETTREKRSAGRFSAVVSPLFRARTSREFKKLKKDRERGHQQAVLLVGVLCVCVCVNKMYLLVSRRRKNVVWVRAVCCCMLLLLVSQSASQSVSMAQRSRVSRCS